MKNKIPNIDTYTEEQLELALKLAPGQKRMVIIHDEGANTVRVDVHHEDDRWDIAIPLPDQAIMLLAKAYPNCKILMLVGANKPRPGYDR